MIVRNALAALVFAPAALAYPVSHSAQDAEAVETRLTSLSFRISPLMDLAMLVRVLAEQEDAVIPEVEGLATAVQAARDAADALGGPSGRGVFLGPLSSAANTEEMLGMCAELPERFTSRSGASFDLRDVSTAYAGGLAAAEPAFLAELWPDRKAVLERRLVEINRLLLPKEREVYDFVIEKLAVTDPQPEIPVYLVTEAPWPGAMTYRGRIGGVSIVGIDSSDGSQLLETVVHESLHALDVSSAEPDVFDQLRSALIEAGIPRTDARIRDVPHMVMFVHAAETVKRHLDPEHVDYGELEMFGRPGLYERDQASVQAVRPAWRAYLDGEIDRDEALERIVKRAGGERKDD